MYLGYKRLHVPENENLTNAVFYAVLGTPYVQPSTSLPNLYFLVWLTTTYRISLICPPCLPSSCSSIYCLDICSDGQGCSLFVTQMCEPRAIWRRWLCCLQQSFPLHSCILFPILGSSCSPLLHLRNMNFWCHPSCFTVLHNCVRSALFQRLICNF